MANWQIKLSLFLNYFVFAILLNSVGTVILQVQGNYGVSESGASILEAFKDLSIAVPYAAIDWCCERGTSAQGVDRVVKHVLGQLQRAKRLVPT